MIPFIVAGPILGSENNPKKQKTSAGETEDLAKKEMESVPTDEETSQPRTA